MSIRPYLGFGLGLRPQHYKEILSQQPSIDWFEIMTEDYLVPGGRPLYYLRKIRESYPIVMHGVSLSIGSVDPLNKDYLKKLKQLIEEFQPEWVSDHLCWTSVNNVHLHDLLPLPYTEAALDHIVERIQEVQEFLGRKILIENVSSYITYQSSQFTEWDFLSHIAKKADCFILLDINNIYVSAHNHQFDPAEYLKAMPKDRIYQFHLAGHIQEEEYIIDTHDQPIVKDVWDLYQMAWNLFGPTSTMIERDDNIPPLKELLNELSYAKQLVI